MVAALAKIKQQAQVIAWAIDLKTYKAAYYCREDEFSFDPRHFIIGIFLKEEPKIDKEKPKYKISKR